MKRVGATIISAVVLAAAAFIAGPDTLARAGLTCTYSPNHCYAVRLGSSADGNVEGVQTTFNDYSMTLGDASHINNSLWIPVNGHTLEIGFLIAPGGQGNVVYDQYVAIDGALQWGRQVSADGSSHRYRMNAEANTTTWYFAIDSTYVYTFNAGAVSAPMAGVTIGGELQTGCCGFNTTQQTSNFHNVLAKLVAWGQSWTTWYSTAIATQVDYDCDFYTTPCMYSYIVLGSSTYDWHKA